MKRLFSLILCGAVIGLAWYAVEQSKLGGWSDFSIAQLLPGAKRPKAAARANNTIRIASFNAQAFGEAKLNDAEAMETLAAIVRALTWSLFKRSGRRARHHAAAHRPAKHRRPPIRLCDWPQARTHGG